MRAQAILFTAVGQVAVGEIELPAPGPGQVLVNTAFSCVSPGTELRCLAGQQANSAPWPFIPGYALTGTVAACGSDADLAPGTPVFCRGTQAASHSRMWGGHVSHAIVAAREVYPLPPGADLQDCAFASMAAIALRGVLLSRPQINEQVAVVGLGPIGQLSARLFALTGARIVAADRVAERVALAQGAGVTALISDGDLGGTFRDALPGGADVVVDATGAPAVLTQTIALARDVPWGDTLISDARLVIQGSYPADVVFSYDAAFMKELTVLLPRDLRPGDIRRALELIAGGTLKVRDLASVVTSPADAPDAYAALRAGAGAMSAVFRWS